MIRERWLRSSDEAAAFDWMRSARELDIPLEIARALYERALRMVHGTDPRQVETLYLRWLHAAVAAARRPARDAVAAPGRKTRVMHEAANPARSRGPLKLDQLGPGKWTRALLELDQDRDDASALPGQGDVQRAMAGMAPGAGISDAA